MKFIAHNYIFSKGMFRKGVTKLDVERLREKPKTHLRKKPAPHKGKSSTSFYDEEKIINIVSGILKPELERIDGSMAAALASVQVVSSSALSYQVSVVSLVEAMLKVFKEEIMTSVHNAHSKPAVEREHTTPPHYTTSKGTTPANPPVVVVDINDEVLSNVMANISHYSTLLIMRIVIM